MNSRPTEQKPLIPEPSPGPLASAEPVPTRPTVPSSRETDANADQKKFTVLIVEDNTEFRTLMAARLSRQYRILTAPNGRDGWEVCRQELPDLVISDIMMPFMDGYALCRKIKETPLTNRIAVILLTVKTELDSRMEGLSNGANDYLTKPFHFDELHLRINNLLSYQQNLRDFYRQQPAEPPVAKAVPAPEDNPFLRQLHEVLEKEVDNLSLTVEFLATEMAMSSRTLNRKLTTVMGVAAKEYIRTYRLRKAALLLRAGYNVSETAYRVGFDNPSYFGQCFKEMFAVSPSEYAQQ